MGLFKDTPPSEHPDFTQLRFMAAGSPSWWKQNRHRVLAIAGLLGGLWLAGHHDATPKTCAPASISSSAH
ncbi:hypothetical protein ABH930_006680 [Kitasatospora sp. GAS204A]|uniref:hypothetical protein n=1 Tax=unclassified Kitasatospora TaxID=2633591 RepID=UPI002476D3E4|nr:hypothetical protein [Kitasatospora sp. GAS204B]MDH6122344.1 hypothetical protein [Kitasatospora sp. GAS204B]